MQGGCDSSTGWELTHVYQLPINAVTDCLLHMPATVTSSSSPCYSPLHLQNKSLEFSAHLAAPATPKTHRPTPSHTPSKLLQPPSAELSLITMQARFLCL